MADISKILTEAWVKVNEGIGSAANSIADATRGKVNEINLNTRRNEILNMLAPKIVEIYKSGVELPEELTAILKELTEVEDKLAALKPAVSTKTPVMEIPEEEDETEETQNAEVLSDETDEDVPVIDVKLEEKPVDVGEVEEKEEGTDDVEYTFTDSDESCEGEGKPDDEVEHTAPDKNDGDLESKEKKGPVLEDEQNAQKKEDGSQNVVNEMMRGMEQAADKVADAARYAVQNPEKVFNKAADAAGKVADEIGKAADKAVDYAQKVLENPEKAANTAADQVGKVVDGIGKAADKAVDYAQKALENPEKAANAAADQVGKVVDGIGKVAEKAANAFTSFIENLSHKDNDQK